MPKHCFILWLDVQNRLQTRDRILRYMSLPETTCVFCFDFLETSGHLFFDCSWFSSCLQKMRDWLGWKGGNRPLSVLLLEGFRGLRCQNFGKKSSQLVLLPWCIGFGMLEIVQFGMGKQLLQIHFWSKLGRL